LTAAFYSFDILRKPSQCLGPSLPYREEMLVAPLVNFCPCFCTNVYPQQTANLLGIKSWLSSPLCPARMTAVESGTRRPVQVSTCWVRTVIMGWSYDESNWTRPWRISLSLCLSFHVSLLVSCDTEVSSYCFL